MGIPDNEEEISSDGVKNLRRFKIAKSGLLNLLQNLVELLENGNQFVAGLSHYQTHARMMRLFCPGLETPPNMKNFEFDSEIKTLCGAVEKIQRVCELLTRDHMKVVFLGQTSNGKSTLINALLGSKVVPVGFGHTTNCFITITGTENHLGCLKVHGKENSLPQEHDISSVQQLANALYKLEASTPLQSEYQPPTELYDSIHLYWPVKKCPLLCEDVVFVDSPGMDMKSDYDQWIDSVCIDADLFVLVVNSESTLKLSERRFFLNVKERISNPNMFILYNRWDCSDPLESQDEESSLPTENCVDHQNHNVAESVKMQHLQDCNFFFCQELELFKHSFAGNLDSYIAERVYFISAKEALLINSGITSKKQLSPSVLKRYSDYLRFEGKFGECLSRSAIKMRFGNHIFGALEIVSNSLTIFQDVSTLITQLLSHTERYLIDLEEIQLSFRKNQEQVLGSCKQCILDLSSDSKKFILEELEKYLQSHLNLVVNEYVGNFSSSAWLDYCQQLDVHVGSRLKADFDANIAQHLSSKYDSMIETMQNSVNCTISDFPLLKQVYLMNGNQNHMDMNTFRKGIDIIKIQMDCNHLSSGFRPDLSFHFSLGWTALRRNFLWISSLAPNFSRYWQESGPPSPQNHPLFIDSSTLDSSNETQLSSLPSLTWLLLQHIPPLAGSFSSYPILMGLVTYFVSRIRPFPSFWRVAFFSGAIYSCFYWHERLNFTEERKKKYLHSQYSNHVRNVLKYNIRQVSMDIGHNIDYELDVHYGILSSRLEHAHSWIDCKLSKMNTCVRGLQVSLDLSESLRFQLFDLQKSLQLFQHQHIFSNVDHLQSM